MGDGAEQALEWAARNMYDPFGKRPSGKNAIAARCPFCQKGIRPIAGEIRQSMEMHIKAKYPEQFNTHE